MSRLEELIKELCPDGVELVKLSKVLDYEQPTKYIVKTTNYDNNFKTPVLTAGQTFILGYTHETDGIYTATKENPTIIFDDFTTSFHWVNFSFKIKSSAMKMLRVKTSKAEDTLLRYVYHCMKNINYEPVDHSRQWIGKYSEFLIPLPPLPVQEEIVRILDNFTELTEELTEELTARKKQYEYYRDSLLTFSDEVEWKKLSEVTSVTIGEFVHQNKQSPDGKYPVFNGGISNTGYYNEYNNLANKIIISARGANAGFVNRMFVNYWAGNSCYSVSIKDELKANWNYIYYVLKQNQNKFVYNQQTGSIPAISKKQVESFILPLPPLPVQEEIVRILDNFTELIAELTAELTARKKQYEYYRDKLLTFKKKQVEVQ